MTIGPAPMIRIVEMSVRFGIASRLRGGKSTQKKGALAARPLSPCEGQTSRGAVSRPDSGGRKANKAAHPLRDFCLFSTGCEFVGDWRPGLDLNQGRELCTALASTLRHQAKGIVNLRSERVVREERSLFFVVNRPRFRRRLIVALRQTISAPAGVRN